MKAILLALMLLASPVWAQTVPVPTQAPQTQITTTAPVTSDTTISIGTLAGQVLQWVAAAFSLPIGALIVGWLLKLMQLTGVQVTAQMKDQLQGIVVNALHSAAANNAKRLEGKSEVVVKDTIVAEAIKYTQQHGAATIKALGLDPKSGEAVEAIKARIEKAIVDPTTPTPVVITPLQQKA